MAFPCLPADFPRWPKRAARWQLRDRVLELTPRPLLMGIVNVTPDSFSDGGQFLDPSVAIEHGLELMRQGADLLDVGGESTRPYSDPVAADEELRRVLPVVQALVEQTKVPISIDTSKSSVAQEAIAAGAQIINDVTALAADRRMLELAARTRVGVCLMHMQGSPQTMQDDPRYDDVVEDVLSFLAARRDACVQAGIPLERIALDPGIGFGKSHGHNLTLLANACRFLELGCPILVGHSRKGFIGKVIGDKEADRTAGTVGAAVALALQGVQILRVHDVAAVRDALLVFEATGMLTGRPLELP